MKKFIAVTTLALAVLPIPSGRVDAGCRNRGGWYRSQAPVYQQYQQVPAPAATAGNNTTYRSFSYDPGTVQPTYQYNYVPRPYSVPNTSRTFPADAKIRGNVMGH